jgi:hypothetical protein
MTDDLASLRKELLDQFADLRSKVRGLPTFGASLEVLHSNIRVLHQDVRELRSAINEFARTNPTTGEIEALHTDVNRVLERQNELEIRLIVLEEAKP